MFSGSIRRNPMDLDCWKTCISCFRCEDKGTKAACNRCSGRNDPLLEKDPYDTDDKCRCHEGVLQYRTRRGQLAMAKLPGNPYTGKITKEEFSQDEQDWNTWLQEERERRDDENFDPIEVN